MKKPFLFLLVLMIFSVFSFAQNNTKTPFKITYPVECKIVMGNELIEPFYISTQPITNRAYIIYLNWLKKCYMDYPEQWYRAWPETGTINGEIDYNDCKNFVELVNSSNPLIKDYMFNPQYIDYPVLGIDWMQASGFCKWLSDRYNEYLLIKKGFLTDDTYALNENCFTLESFLAGQYERQANKEFKDKNTGEIGIKWQHHLLTPSFRLPTQLESKLAAKDKILSNEMKAYPLPVFLKPWECLDVKGNKIIIRDCFTEKKEEFGFSTNDAKLPATSSTEWFLDTFLENKGNSVLSVFAELGQNTLNYDEQSMMEKDSLGNMRYMILTEKNKVPLIVGSKPVLPEGYLQSKNCIFRYVVHAVNED